MVFDCEDSAVEVGGTAHPEDVDGLSSIISTKLFAPFSKLYGGFVEI